MAALRIILVTLWPLIPVISYFANLFKKKRLHPLLLYLIACVMGYFVLLLGVWATEQYLEAKMDSFDLDQDGGFDSEELTLEAEAVMEEWASDTGRNFAPILGIPMTAIWTMMCFTVFYGGEWIVRKTVGKITLQKQVRNTAQVEHRPDDDNPFHPPTNV